MAIEGVTSLSDEVSVANMKKYVEGLLKQNLYNEANPMDAPFLAYKNHVARVAKALEQSGFDFLAWQQVFKSMNPGPIGTGKIINPLTPFGAPPGAEGYITDNADIPISSFEGIPKQDILKDQHKMHSQQLWEKQKQMNLYDDKNRTTDHFYIDSEMAVSSAGVNGTSQVESGVPGIQYTVPDYGKIFENKNSGPDFGNGEFGAKFWMPKKDRRMAKEERDRRLETAVSNHDTFFTSGEVETGYVGPDEYSADGISDSTNYMPFFLEDLRSGGKRIYFRAFFKNIRESISPNWTTDNYFGRVDPVGIYTGTSRQINVSFSVVAFSPEGFSVMWRKMNVLAKMLYPTYKDGVMVKSPVCRLRIGDVVCDAAGAGLTGYINSPLELDYSDSSWEISEWIRSEQKELGKAPMMINVSFSFQVIHEQNPSVDDDYRFDTTFFRRIGQLNEFQPSSRDESGNDNTTNDGVSNGEYNFTLEETET